MSQANVELVRRLYELWNTDPSPEALLPFVAPEFRYVNPDYAVEGGDRHGHEGFRSVLASLRDAFDFYEHRPRELIDLGDSVLCHVTFVIRTGDGALVEQLESQIWTLRDGLVTTFQWFHDDDEARAAAARL